MTGTRSASPCAGVAIFDLTGPHVQVAHRPLSRFVCSGRGADAHTVIIDGEILLREGRFTRFSDVEEVIGEATARGRAGAERAGVANRAALRWPRVGG